MLTSDLRRALCSHICHTVLGADAAIKRDLAQRLDALPFERMSDPALIETAFHFLPDDEMAMIIDRFSAVKFTVEDLYLCWHCQDRHVMPDPDGDGSRWTRCMNCNPGASPDDPPQPTKRGHR